MRRSCPASARSIPRTSSRAIEYRKGNYVLLDDEEIEAVKLESKKTLELTQFVDADEIDPLYYEKPYYVVPADDLAEEAFIVLREALRRDEEGRRSASSRCAAANISSA